jgi:hypothetical protein
MDDATGSASFLALTGLATFAFTSAIRGSSSYYSVNFVLYPEKLSSSYFFEFTK